ncbi:MAG: hypothetical protein ACRDRL_32090 [Sciscionella sp.]
MLDETLLDDADALATQDRDGLLRACALGGAQVRATLEAITDADLAQQWADAKPRALVLIDRPGIGAGVNELLLALLGEQCPIPVLRAPQAPSWVGPLDVVFAHSADPVDMVLARSIDRGGRRGARILLAGQTEGPLAAAAAGNAVLVTPHVAVPPGYGYPAALANGLALLGVLGLYRGDVDVLADALDLEAQRCSPSVESFVNPAKSLALRLTERLPLLWGVDPLADAVVTHAAEVLAARAALVCDAAPYSQAVTRWALHARAQRESGAAGVFADPFADPEPTTAALRMFLFSVEQSIEALTLRSSIEAALPAADVVSTADEPDGTPVEVSAACLALRLEMAAVYLGLAEHTIGGPGRAACTAIGE